MKRQTAVDRLSELVGIQVAEQPSGGLSVAIGGEFLVFEGQRREVEVSTTQPTMASRPVSLQFADTQSPLQYDGRRAARTVHGPRRNRSAASSTSWTTWPARWRLNSTRCIRKARAWSASSS